MAPYPDDLEDDDAPAKGGKKGMPGWAYMLIAGGVLFALAVAVSVVGAAYWMTARSPATPVGPVQAGPALVEPASDWPVPTPATKVAEGKKKTWPRRELAVWLHNEKEGKARTGEEIKALLGKPESTKKVGDHFEWQYRGLTVDADSGKVDSLTVLKMSYNDMPVFQHLDYVP